MHANRQGIRRWPRRRFDLAHRGHAAIRPLRDPRSPTSFAPRSTLHAPRSRVLFVLMVVQMIQAITRRTGALRTVAKFQRRIGFLGLAADGAAVKRFLLRGDGWQLDALPAPLVEIEEDFIAQ